MKIAVVGTGYVGLSIAILLAQYNEVWAVDINSDKVDKINKKNSPIVDTDIEEYLANHELNLKATIDSESAFKKAEFVIIATPTNYDPVRNYFDTSCVEVVIEEVNRINPNAIMVIRSTVPVGFTNQMKKKYLTNKIIFSPEFLREGKALHDNLYPTRVIVGTDINDLLMVDRAHLFADLLLEGAIKENVEVRIMWPMEAEAVKLFANTYLALRVAFFN